jgi:serine/threonine-protein kinase
VVARIEVGQILAGNWRIEGLLGEGAVGQVFGAINVRDGVRAAIKVVHDPHMDATERARFEREARIATQLRGEHTVRALEAGTLEDGRPYIVMERLDGEDLERRVLRDGPQAPTNVVKWGLDACAALEEAHGLGIVHRDLKPANLFLARSSRGSILKVLDFGLSKVPDTSSQQRLTESLTSFGSPAYMAPEQIVSAQRVDTRADIYSLGVSLYEMITGQLPYRTGSTAELCAAVVGDPPTPIGQLRPGLPTKLAGAIHKCLEKNPRDRFQNVGELKAVLFDALVDPVDAPKTIEMSQMSRPPSSPTPSKRPSKLPTVLTREPSTRTLVLAATASAVVVIALGLAIVFLVAR